MCGNPAISGVCARRFQEGESGNGSQHSSEPLRESERESCRAEMRSDEMSGAAQTLRFAQREVREVYTLTPSEKHTQMDNVIKINTGLANDENLGNGGPKEAVVITAVHGIGTGMRLCGTNRAHFLQNFLTVTTAFLFFFTAHNVNFSLFYCPQRKI